VEKPRWPDSSSWARNESPTWTSGGTSGRSCRTRKATSSASRQPDERREPGCLGAHRDSGGAGGAVAAAVGDDLGGEAVAGEGVEGSLGVGGEGGGGGGGGGAAWGSGSRWGVGRAGSAPRRTTRALRSPRKNSTRQSRHSVPPGQSSQLIRSGSSPPMGSLSGCRRGPARSRGTLSGGCDNDSAAHPVDQFDRCEELARPIPLRYGAAAAPLLRRQLPDQRSCRIDRSDAAGASRPSVAPAEGYGPRFPRVGAVAASRRSGARTRPKPLSP